MTVGKPEVILRTDFNRCVVTENSDAAISFTTGGFLAKNLVWGCTPFDISDLSLDNIRLDRIIIEEVSGSQCYTVRHERLITEGICGQQVPVPVNPILSVQFNSISVGPFNEPDHLGFELCLQFQNTGNITALGFQKKTFLDGVSIGGGGIGGILPGEIQEKNCPSMGSSAFFLGQVLNITVDLIDFLDNVIDSRSIQYTIQ